VVTPYGTFLTDPGPSAPSTRCPRELLRAGEARPRSTVGGQGRLGWLRPGLHRILQRRRWLVVL